MKNLNPIVLPIKQLLPKGCRATLGDRIMRLPKQYMACSLLAVTAMLTACGGDGGADVNLGDSSDVVSSGVITQFGSVYVNGVRYDTSSTQVISGEDGSVIFENPTDNDQLRQFLALGQVVTVRGSSNDDGSNGVALAVIIDHELVGPIASVSAADHSFVVLGQTVSVTPDTIIDDSIIEAIIGRDLTDDVRFADIEQAAGQALTLAQLLNDTMVLEINGFPSHNGLEATRIEDLNNRDRSNGNAGGDIESGEAEVKGVVTNLGSNQFEINGLTVSYDDSDLDSEDFSSAGLTTGQFVEVKGNILTSSNIDATRIKLEDDLFDGSVPDSDNSRIEVEGGISEVSSDAQGSGGSIIINGVAIPVDDISQFSEGQRVEIKGSLQSGILMVDQVREESEDTIRVEDRVDTIDNNSITTQLGIVITPSSRTRLDDNIADDDNTSIIDFVANADSNFIEARGFSLNGSLSWNRARIDDDDDIGCRLRGPVDSISDTDSFVIQGVTIDVSALTSINDFRDASDVGIGRDVFFGQLETGDVVQAQSIDSSEGCQLGLLTAREVEFEPADNRFDDGIDDNDGGLDNEINGTVTSVSDDSFVINGETITVIGSTLIDDSIIEAARGLEINGDQQRSSLDETLAMLLPVGLSVAVVVDRSSGVVATSIEDL